LPAAMPDRAREDWAGLPTGLDHTRRRGLECGAVGVRAGRPI
jgi:hypothetical protein